MSTSMLMIYLRQPCVQADVHVDEIFNLAQWLPGSGI